MQKNVADNTQGVRTQRNMDDMQGARMQRNMDGMHGMKTKCNGTNKTIGLWSR